MKEIRILTKAKKTTSASFVSLNKIQYESYRGLYPGRRITADVVTRILVHRPTIPTARS